MAVRPEAAERLTPHLAGWFAAETPPASYGGPLRLASPAPAGSTCHPRGSAGSARRRRSSCSSDVGIAAIGEHDMALANRFRAGLGLEPGDSAIVSVRATNVRMAERLGAAA